MYRLFLSNGLHDEVPTQDIFETEQEAKIACSEENLSSERRMQTARYTVKEENTFFYEVEFGRKDMPHDTDSICILGVRKPTLSEAAEFCKEDMKWFGYDKVKKVTPLSISDAKKFFDTEDNHLWRVFGKEKKMKLYKHVYNEKAEIKTIEFEVTETPKLYIVVDRDLFGFVWERQIKKEDIGKFNGKSTYSYNMITTTSDTTPFIKALINTEEDYEEYLKEELEKAVHRKTQLLKLLKEDDYDGVTINCPECGKEIVIEVNTARCDKCDWSASDADLDEIMNED